MMQSLRWKLILMAAAIVIIPVFFLNKQAIDIQLTHVINYDTNSKMPPDTLNKQACQESSLARAEEPIDYENRNFRHWLG